MLETLSLSSATSAVFTVAVVIPGCIAAGFSLYLLVLSVAALFYTDDRSGRVPATSELIVLIPAHDEAAQIGRCIRSLQTQSYPRGLYKIAVIADNCTDETAAIATASGADIVMTRDEPEARGKGYALRWAMDRLLASESAAAIVVVDADSMADREFLLALVAPFEAGAQVVQGEYRLLDGGSSRASLRVAAVLLINRVRPAGRAVLGLSGLHLNGNGMLFSRDLLLTKPWDAFTSAEDLEYSVDLRSRGAEIAFAGGALVTSPAAPNANAAAEQQLRWEGGKAHVAREWIPQLIVTAVRDRRPALLGIVLDLSIPPLGFLAVGVLGGIVVGALLALVGLISAWALVPWLLAAIAIPLLVVIGLIAGHASSSEYRALARAPLFILAKPLRIRRIVAFRGDTWVRTERAPGPEVSSDP